MAEQALAAARALAAGRDPKQMAWACGCDYEGTEKEGTFAIPFLGGVARLAYPGFEPVDGDLLPPHVLALLVYHLALSQGVEPTGEWISFSDLPDGSFYFQAFRGYTAAMIARRFGGDTEALVEALKRLNAEPLGDLADRAWLVPALPRIPVALLWWDGDEEFPPRADLLFDETASKHLQTDGLAVLGSWMTSRLLQSAGEPGT